MATTEEIKQRIEGINIRYQKASTKKAELQGQLEAKKAELISLSQEIKNAGYDPRKLKEEKERLEKELDQDLAACDRELAEVEAALREFDKK